MDQILARILAFDRFTLDLTRGSLRVGAEPVQLPPKAFEVLCYFVSNAGRLISKQELHDGVWGPVAVSDDSLVQCVRQLRQKLGDDEHRLIKTVPKRGYLFDAVVTSRTQGVSTALNAEIEFATPTPSLTAPSRTRTLAIWVAAIGLLGAAAALTLIAYPQWGSTRVGQWFWGPSISLPETVAQRIAVLSQEKELPLPEFHIARPYDDLPDYVRRFIGIWVSDEGWAISGRQLMVIVTKADRNGVVHGYLVNGPAKPRSRVPGPAFTSPFTGQIIDRTLRHDGRIGMAHAIITPEGRMDYRIAFENGGAGSVTLDPIWRLSADQDEAQLRHH